jgi:two-component system chemotaxis response regulator CheB
MTLADPVTRLLIIDDSVRVRRAVARALEKEPGIEVVAAMRNGRAAVTRSQRLGPDVVLLDAAAGDGGTCATLAELRRLDPTPRVVMRDELGAAGGTGDEEEVRRSLLAAILGLPVRARAAGGAHSPSAAAPQSSSPPAEPPRGTSMRRSPRTPPAAVRAVAIAASTGGPDALETVLAALPATLPAPVFVVQHMPADFTRMLAERLDRRTGLAVTEAVAGDDVLDGRVYIAPGNRHLALERGPGGARIVLHSGPPENSCRPAADVLFRSAAALYGSGLLAVVLTGMGSDGLRGAEAVHGAGGRVLAQSESSAVIASMPRAVARARLTDDALDPAQLGPRIAAMVAGGTA